jgi:hypothetical protein
VLALEIDLNVCSADRKRAKKLTSNWYSTVAPSDKATRVAAARRKYKAAAIFLCLLTSRALDRWWLMFIVFEILGVPAIYTRKRRGMHSTGRKIRSCIFVRT